MGTDYGSPRQGRGPCSFVLCRTQSPVTRWVRCPCVWTDQVPSPDVAEPGSAESSTDRLPLERSGPSPSETSRGGCVVRGPVPGGGKTPNQFTEVFLLGSLDRKGRGVGSLRCTGGPESQSILPMSKVLLR